MVGDTHFRARAIKFFVWFTFTIVTAFLAIFGVFTAWAGGNQMLAILYMVIFYIICQIIVAIMSMALAGIDVGR